MAKQNNFGMWIIVGILIVLFLPKYGLFFIITGAEEVKRDYPSVVDAGAIIDMRYEVYCPGCVLSGKWGVSIMDTLACPGYPEISKKIVMISTEGIVKIVQYQIPDEEGLTCTFSGNYQFGDKSVKNFMSQTILTRITYVAHSTYKCYSSDVYWYDSDGVRNDKKEECGTSAYTGSNYCYNNDVYRDYVTRGCSGSSCTQSTSKIKQEDCGTLGCSGGVCNVIVCQSGADSNDDGVIDRLELGSYINKWINGQITRTKLGQAIMEWVDGC